MPPPKEEDWENEVQEVTSNDWEKMCSGVRPYGKYADIKYNFKRLNPSSKM